MRQQNIPLNVGAREPHRNRQEKSVQLRFRQWKGAHFIGIIACGNDEKWLGQLTRHPFEGHTPLIHALE